MSVDFSLSDVLRRRVLVGAHLEERQCGLTSNLVVNAVSTISVLHTFGLVDERPKFDASLGESVASSDVSRLS